MIYIIIILYTGTQSPLSVFTARYSLVECESLLLMWPLYTIPNSPNKGTHTIKVMTVQNNLTIKKNNTLPCPMVSFSLILADGIIRCDGRSN